MGTTVGEIDLGLNIDRGIFNKQIQGLANSARNPIMNAFKPIGKMIGSVLAVGAITKFTKSCLDLGSDLTEVQNVVDTTFKTLNGSVNEFASNAMTAFGLSETVAKQYMGTLGAMSKSMGFSEQASYDMASAVTGLTGDVASFYNLSTDEAFNKLKAIWTGETETLKSIGVLLTQTNLDQYALNNGFGKTTATMTEQEKVMLRYQYTMSALADASGDFAKTSGSWANQTRILSLQFESLKATLGQGFINLFTPIIQMINALLARLQVLAQYFKSFTELLVGRKGESSGIASIGKDAAGAVSGINGITDAAKAAAKATGLLSIDELNVVGESKASEPSGSIPDLGLSGSETEQIPGVFDEIDSKMQSLVENAQKFIERIKTIFNDFKIGDFFKAGKDVSGLVSDIFDFVSKAIKKVDWKGIGNKVGAFLRGIDWLAVLESLKNVIWEAVKGAASAWFGMFEEAPFETALITAIALWKFTDFGKTVGTLISDAIPSTYTKNIGLKIAAIAITWEVGFDIGKEIGKLLFPDDAEIYDNFTWFGDGGFFDEVFSGYENIEDWANTQRDAAFLWGKDICDWWSDWWKTSVEPWFSPKNWTTLLSNISPTFKNAWSSLMDWWNNSALVTWWNDNVSPWFTAEKWQSLWVDVQNAFTTKWDEIKEWWNSSTLVTWWDDSVAPWFTAEKWGGIFGNIKTAFSDKWTEIKKWWDNNALSKWWNDSVAPWFTAEKWLESMVGIKDAFATAFKNACNAGINIFNKFINWVNEKMHFSWDAISIAGKEIIPSGDMQLFSIPNIPLLAQGGYVGADQPQLAVIGDNKHEGEIVSPESKLLDMAVQAAEMAKGNNLSSELLMTVIELLSKIITILENLNLDIELDGRSLVQSLKESQSRLGHQF